MKQARARARASNLEVISLQSREKKQTQPYILRRVEHSFPKSPSCSGEKPIENRQETEHETSVARLALQIS